ncbi:unnamed protein product [Linum trigynum]|uniref:Uncharacterized protein n=1 Tax=Linum trigynum TaxID=586398 RepID=A0AAV2CEQ6_9ROSI
MSDDNFDMETVIIDDITDEEELNPMGEEWQPKLGLHQDLQGNTKSQTNDRKQPMAWGENKKKLFSEAVQEVEWYVAESDSEDIAEAVKEDD